MSVAKPRLSSLDAIRFVEEETARCERDFLYFARTHLFYADRDGQVVTFEPNMEQLLLLGAVEDTGQVLNLKARKLGMSTLLCFYAIWLAMFHGTKCALLAHDDKSVKNLVREKFRFPLDQLPSYFKTGRFRIKEDNLETGLFFVGGGSLRVSHNEGAAFRGGDVGFLHISEFAFLKDPDATFAAAMNACLKGAPKVLESTANGYGKMHELWYGDDNAWRKMFFPWKGGPMYRRDDRVTELEGMINSIKMPDNRSKFIDYARENKLNKGQAAWALLKLSESNFDWVNFHREYPATPEHAFSMSSGRVFSLSFIVGKPQQGHMDFVRPALGIKTTLGVDSANGFEDGDYQAYALLSGTRKKPLLHATGYFRKDILDFGDNCVDLGIKNNSLIICDAGQNGVALLEHMRRKGYPLLYRRRVFDRKGSQAVEKLGYAISDSTRGVLVMMMRTLFGGDRPLMTDVRCPRLQWEINNFIYNPEKVGNRPEAGPGAHDDLLFAVALAYFGLDEEGMTQHVGGIKARPVTDADQLRWELVNGKEYDPLEDFDDDTEELRRRNAKFRELRRLRGGGGGELLPILGE